MCRRTTVSSIILVFLGFSLPRVAPAQVDITGGTPEQRERLFDAVRWVPDCLKESNQPGGPDLTVEVLDGEFGAFYDERTVSFHPAMVTDDGDKELSRYAFWQGLHQMGLWYYNDTRRVALHEIAHHAHFYGGYPVDEFLEIGYRKKLEALQNNERFKELAQQAGEIDESLRGHRRSAGLLEQKMDDLDRAISIYEEFDQTQASRLKDERFETMGKLFKIYNDYFAQYDEKLRPLVDEIRELYNEAGFPSRHHNDLHALNSNGAEYFAMAIEMLVFDHDGFCRSYSPEEMEWLHAHLGPCLRNIKAPLAPCYVKLTPENAERTASAIVHTIDSIPQWDYERCQKPDLKNSGPAQERDNPDVFDDRE